MLQKTFAPIQRMQEDQERAAQDMAREQVAQENSTRLEQYNAAGRATYKDPATGLVQPKVPEEQWTAEQGAKVQKAADKEALKTGNADLQARFKAEARPFYTNAQGQVVPLHPEETWQAIKAGKDDPLKLEELDKLTKQRQAPLEEQIKTLSLDVNENPERRALGHGERRDLETKAKKGIEAAREALLSQYGTQAKATTGGAWYNPFSNGDATPEAMAAQGKTKAIGEVMADPSKALALTDDEVNDLAKVNPGLHADVLGHVAALKADDERRTWGQQARQQLYDLKLRRENPAKWEADHLKALETASPEEARGRIEAMAADVGEERALLENHALELADTGARFDQAQQALVAQNAAARAQGIAADRIVTGPDGQAWDVTLLAQYEQAQREGGAWQVKVGPRMEALKAAMDGHNQRIARLNAAVTGVQQREQEGRKAALEKLRAQSPELADLEGEREQRLTEVAAKYPEGTAQRERAVKAIHDDVEGRGKAVQERMAQGQQQSRQAAGEAWGELGKAMDRGEDVTLLKQQKTTELAKKLGTDEAKARTMLEDAQKADWVRGDANEVTRLTSDGQVLVKPDLWDDEAKFKAAVAASGGSEEAKAQTLKAFPALKQESAKAKVEALQGYAPFRAWAQKQGPGLSEVALMDKWMAERPKWKAHLDQLMIGAVQGTLGIVQAGAGVAQWAGVEGADKLAAGAGKDAGRVGAISQAQPAGQWTAMGANLITSSLPAMVAGGLVGRIGIAGAEMLGVLPRAVTAGEAALVGARAERVAKLINAGAFGGTAGVQSFGQTYAEAAAAYREMGLTKEQAEARATMPALGAALSTSILTALGANSGAEALTSATAKKTIKDGVKGYLKAVFGGALHEAVLEEVPDQLIQDLIAKATYEPNKTVQEITDDVVQTFFGAAAFGGAMQALSGVQGLKESMRGQQEVMTGTPVHERPETVAAAQAAIEGLAVQDVGTLPKQLVVAGSQEQGAGSKDAPAEVDLVASNERAQGAAFALLDVARGADVTTLPTQDIELLGLERKGDKLVPAKEGTPLVEVTEDGQAIITQGALDWLAKELPEVREAIGLDERTRREQIKQGAGSKEQGDLRTDGSTAAVGEATTSNVAKAPSSKVVEPSASKPVDHVPDAGKMVAPSKTPVLDLANNTPEGKRTQEVARYLSGDLHLSEEKAAKVAAHIVGKMGVVGDMYLAQVIKPEFKAALRELGFTGSLSGKEQGSNPLTAPVDLEERLKLAGSKEQGAGSWEGDEIPMGAPGRMVKDEGGKMKAETPAALPRAKLESRSGVLLREMRAVAQRVAPGKRAQAERTLAAVGKALGERHAVFDRVAVGAEARALHADKKADQGANPLYITPLATVHVDDDGQITLALNLDRIVADHATLKDPTSAVRAMVREEIKHALSLRLEGEGDARFSREAKIGYWRALPQALKQQVWMAYRSGDISGGKAKEELPANLTDKQEKALAEEFIRMLSQNEDFGERITETVDPSTGLLDKIVAVLKGLADKLREFLKGAQGDLKADLEHVLKNMIKAEQRFAAASKMHEFDQVQNRMQVTAGQVLLKFQQGKAEGFTDEAMGKLFESLPSALQKAIRGDGKLPVGQAMRNYVALMVGDPMVGRHVAESLTVQRNRGALAGLRALWNKVLALTGDPIAAMKSLPGTTASQMMRLAGRVEALRIAGEAGIWAGTVKPVNLADLAGRAVGDYEQWWNEELAKVEAADSWEGYKADRVARSAIGWAAYVKELEARQALGYLHGLLPGRMAQTVGQSDSGTVGQEGRGADRAPDYLAPDLAGLRAKQAAHDAQVLALARSYRLRQLHAASQAEIAQAVKDGKVTDKEALHAQRLVSIGTGAADRYADPTRMAARAIGFSMLRTLRELGIGVTGGNLFTVDTGGDAYVERRHVIIRQSALEDLERKLPMTRQLIEMTEAQAREHYGLPAGEARPQMRADTEALAEAERVRAAQGEALPEESQPNAVPVVRPDNKVTGGLSPSGLTREEYLAMSPGAPANATKAGPVLTGAEDIEDRMAGDADKYLDKAEKAKAREDARAVKEAARRPALMKLLKQVPNASTGDTTRNNVLEALLRSPMPMPPAAKRKGRGEWDWMETSPLFTEKGNFWWRSKLFRVDASITKGDLAGRLKELAKDGHFPDAEGEVDGYDLSDAIMNAMGQLDAVKRGDPVTAKAIEQEQVNEDEARTVRFERDTDKGPIAIEPSSLRAGEVLVVKDEAGEPHRLVVQSLNTMPVDAEDFHPNENPLQFVQDGKPVELLSVTLQDGPTYGLQTVAPDRIIYVDGIAKDEGGEMLAAGGRGQAMNDQQERALVIYRGLVKLEREGKKLTTAQQGAKEEAERVLGQQFLPFGKSYAPREDLRLESGTEQGAGSQEAARMEQLALFAGGRRAVEPGFYSRLEETLGAMTKRFDQWYESPEAQGYVLRAEVLLPGVTFERAGTGVSTRVVVLDKITPVVRSEGRVPHEPARRVELTNAEDVKEFFARLKDVTLPPRPEPTGDLESGQESGQSEDQVAGNEPGAGVPARSEMDTIPVADRESTWSPAQTKHSKTGADLYVVRIMRRLSKEEYGAALTAAKALGGWYSSYKADGAIPGFQFKSAEARDAFIGAKESTGGKDEGVRMKDEVVPVSETDQEPPSYLARNEAQWKLWDMDQKVEQAKTPMALHRQVGDVRSGDTAFTVEQLTHQIVRLKDAVESMNGRLLRGGDKGASAKQLSEDWLMLQRWERLAEQSRAQDPAAWRAYETRQRQIQGLEAGDQVLVPYPSSEQPLGTVGTILRKFSKNWKVETRSGSEMLINPTALRPVTDQTDVPLAAASRTIDEAAHEAATSPRNELAEPTEAQKKAGNYRKGHVRIGGLEMSIENPEGSVRRGTDASGKAWAVPMTAHYGYVLNSEGKDGDHVDVFVKPGTPADWSGPVYVVDQKDVGTGRFDEHKAMIGVASADEARALYLSNYSPGWQGLGPVTAMPWESFKRWARSEAAQKKAARTPHPTEHPTDKRVERAAEMADDIRLAAGGRGDVKDSLTADDYLAAVEAGDMVTAQRMVDAAAKAAGYTQVWYHKTSSATPFDVFDVTRGDLGAHFGTEEQANQLRGGTAGKVGRYFVKLDAPLRLKDKGGFHADSVAPQLWANKALRNQGVVSETQVERWTRMGDGAVAERKQANAEIRKVLLDAGYDGVIYANQHEGKGDSIIVFKPERIKSADPVTRDTEGKVIPLSQRFNADSPSILYAGGRGVATDEPNPLARLGWNHLDKAASGKVAAMTAKPLATVGDAVSEWMQQPGVTPTVANGVARFLQAQLLPQTVLPREVTAAIRQMNIRAALGGQRAMDLQRALTGTPKFSDLGYPKEFVENPVWRERLFDAMEGRVALATLPAEMQALGQRLRAMLVDIGREAVTAGRMSLDTFEGLQSTFMPRFTRDEAEAMSGNFLKKFKLGVKDILQQRSTAWHIVDSSAKDPRTGEYLTVPWDEKGKKWRFRDEQHRNGFYEELVKREAVRALQEGGPRVNDLLAALPYATKQAVRAQIAKLTPAQVDRPAELSAETARVVKRAVQLMRDRYLKQEPFEPEKLIKDPVYAIARYAAQMSHDNATAEFFNFVARSPQWVRDAAATGYVQIPDNSRFGRLAGKFVQEDIARQVTEMVEAPNEALRVYDTLLGWWKTGKTVLNPGTHVRNVLSNIFFGQLAGVNPLNAGNWGYYRDAVAALRNGGDVLTKAYEHGVLGADFVAAELRQKLRGLLPPAEEVKDERDILSIGKRIGQVLPDWARRPITSGYNTIASLYQVEDEVFKLAAWMKAQHMGMTPEAAAEHVRKWFPYFDKGSSTTLRALGRTVMPFLGFYRESARIFGHALRERPLALATGMAIPSLLTAMSAMLLGLDKDELDQVKKDMRGKGGKLLGPTPLSQTPLFSILLPMTTGTGALQQWDLSAIHPFADFLGTRVEKGDNKGDWWSDAWRSLLAAGPLGNLVYAQATGRDAFGDRQFVEDNMTAGEKVAARGKSIGTLLLPPLTPFVGSNYQTIATGGTRSVDKSLAMRSPVQAVTRAVGGIDVRSANPDIYRIADDWRQAHGLPTSEGMDFGGTTPASRMRKLLFTLLAQEAPNMGALANALKRMDELGVGIKNQFDLQKVLLYRDPMMIIQGKQNQAKFRASLTGQERRVLEEAERTYREIKARAPGLIAQARAGGR